MTHDQRNSRRFVTVALTLSLLAPYTPLAAEEVAPRRDEQPATRAWFYRVTDSEKRELWLLGSIHLADESIYPLPAHIEAAWASSEVVAVEADIVTANMAEVQSQMMQAAMDTSGRTLSKRLPKELYAEVGANLESFGMDIGLLEPARPWFVAILLANLALSSSGLSSEHGIETHFLRRAGEREVVELEGVARQLEIFGGMSEEMQVLFLRHALADSKISREKLRELLTVWQTGDDAALLATRRQIREDNPALAPIDELFFTRRNREMAEKIAGYIASPKTHFVIVGAGHIPGEDGVVHLLEQRGLTVERR